MYFFDFVFRIGIGWLVVVSNLFCFVFVVGYVWFCIIIIILIKVLFLIF